jgi:putative oxidoreductase
MALKDAALLGARLVVGGYLTAHGAQKMFGAFDGPGLEAAGGGFHSMGLTPGREMAMLAAGSELGGGVLTMAGVADPIGPIALAGTMVVASVVHGPGGPFSAKGGYELTLTNLAAAAALAAAGPGRYRLSPPAPRVVTIAAGVIGTALTGWSVKKLTAARRSPAPAVDTPTEQTEQTLEDIVEETLVDGAVAEETTADVVSLPTS